MIFCFRKLKKFKILCKKVKNLECFYNVDGIAISLFLVKKIQKFIKSMQNPREPQILDVIKYLKLIVF